MVGLVFSWFLVLLLFTLSRDRKNILKVFFANDDNVSIFLRKRLVEC